MRTSCLHHVSSAYPLCKVGYGCKDVFPFKCSKELCSQVKLKIFMLIEISPKGMITPSLHGVYYITKSLVLYVSSY